MHKHARGMTKPTVPIEIAHFACPKPSGSLPVCDEPGGAVEVGAAHGLLCAAQPKRSHELPAHITLRRARTCLSGGNCSAGGNVKRIRRSRGAILRPLGPQGAGYMGHGRVRPHQNRPSCEWLSCKGLKRNAGNGPTIETKSDTNAKKRRSDHQLSA